METSLLRIVSVLSLSVFTWGGSQESIPDLVRRVGHIERVIVDEYQPAQMADLLKESDLVARVRIVASRSRLADHERRVVTDYDAQVLEPILPRRPTASPVITITRPGGQLMVDGRSVVVTERDYPPFEPGAEYILFLAVRQDTFETVYGGQGAFSLEAELAAQMSRFRAVWQESVSAGKPVPVHLLLAHIQKADRNARRGHPPED